VFGFEKIVQAFQQKVHGTVLEVNLDALVHNLNYYRSKLAGRHQADGDGEGLCLWQRQL
jgi:hypothetical protein